MDDHQWFKCVFKPHGLHNNCELILFDDLDLSDMSYYKDFMNVNPFYVSIQWFKPTLSRSQTSTNHKPLTSSSVVIVWYAVHKFVSPTQRFWAYIHLL
jgi:hypothetical protein